MQTINQQEAAKKFISYTWTDRRGNKYNAKHSLATAAQRLSYLDADELKTQRVAPTDSGDVRFSYNAEAAAIRSAIFNSGYTHLLA